MLKLLFRNRIWFSSPQRYRLEDYSRDDFATMCGLLREKYFLNNEEVQSSGLIKLTDDSGKVIGIYTASEARKKAVGLGLDMVLVTLKTSPIVCKVADFRGRLVHKFYNEIVVKRQKELLVKATSVKSLKISPALNRDELGLKIKQLVQLTLKNMKVRATMQVSQNNKQECLGKLEWVKSQLLNKCYIEEQISNRRHLEQDENEQLKTNRRSQTYSFVIRARETNFIKTALQEKNLEPDAAIKTFLRKYYQQDDGEMMDLKSAGFFETDSGINIEQQIAKYLPDVKGEEIKDINSIEADLLREAEARVLNKRLKQLLSFYQ